MIVRANIRFGLHSSFLDRGFEAEDERLPGESIEDGVLRVEAALTRAEDILRQRTAAKIDGAPNVQTTPNAPYSIPTISKDSERAEIAIDNAETLADLQLLKEEAGKYGLLTQYIKKFNELNNGRPSDFTEGLQ
jgi:hypothetical protein